MTQAQKTNALSTLKELEALAPNVDWHVSYNYYTKLPEFQAIKNGGVEFSMHKQDGDREMVTNEYGARYPHYTHRPHAELIIRVTDAKVSSTGMIVSHGLPKPTVTAELPRVNFKKYIEFVKANLGLLESIGA